MKTFGISPAGSADEHRRAGQFVRGLDRLQLSGEATELPSSPPTSTRSRSPTWSSSPGAITRRWGTIFALYEPTVVAVLETGGRAGKLRRHILATYEKAHPAKVIFDRDQMAGAPPPRRARSGRWRGTTSAPSDRLVRDSTQPRVIHLEVGMQLADLLERPLGRWLDGQVWAAVDERENSREVAIKVAAELLAPSQRRAFASSGRCAPPPRSCTGTWSRSTTTASSRTDAPTW